MLMKPEVIIPDNNQSTAGFHQFVGGYHINMPCIKTDDNNALYTYDLYSLYDFKDKGVYERTVRFYHAYLKGYVVTLVLLDLESGELLKRKHRLNISSLPCDWMLTNTDFLDPTRQKGDLHNACF